MVQVVFFPVLSVISFSVECRLIQSRSKTLTPNSHSSIIGNGNNDSVTLAAVHCIHLSTFLKPGEWDYVTIGARSWQNGIHHR